MNIVTKLYKRMISLGQYFISATGPRNATQRLLLFGVTSYADLPTYRSFQDLIIHYHAAG